MYRVNIYVMTDIKGPRRRDGVYAYILEVMTEKGPATCQVFKKVEDITENRAELTAAVEGLKRLNQSCDIDLFTESKYVAAAIEKEWLKFWQRNGWENAKGREIANRDLWQKMADLLNGSNICVHLNEHHPYTKCMRFELERKHKELLENGGINRRCLINLENLILLRN